MKYEINNKMINIPDNEIENSIANFEITQEEAIKMWLEDEGYIRNEEQEALEEKAKKNKITATIHQAKTINNKKVQKNRVKKENPVKEMIIQQIANLLPEFAEKVEITNKSKYISFTIGTETYEINLIQKRKPKK